MGGSSIKAVAKANENLRCSYEDRYDGACNKLRNGASLFCAGHKVKVAKYGAPNARPYQENLYARSLNEVRNYLYLHLDHEAVQHAIRQGKVIINGYDIKDNTIKDIMALQQLAGLSGFELFMHVMAMNHYEFYYEPNKDVPLQYHTDKMGRANNNVHWLLVANKVMHLKRTKEKPKSIKPKARRQLADLLRKTWLETWVELNKALSTNLTKEFPSKCVTQIP